MPPAPPNRSLFFLHNADGLYTATRFAFFARMVAPLFRLSHNALEYYLKSYLVEHRSLAELKNLSHRLPPLYEKYIEVANPLVDHSELIAYLDNFERLRYPRDEKFRMRAWDRPFAELFREFPSPAARAQILWFDLQGYDALVAAIRLSIGPTRELPFMVATDDHAAYLYRDNVQFQR